MWKKLPLPLRNYAHHKAHRFNSNRLLLLIFAWRHEVTCKSLAGKEDLQLRVGESRNFEGWVSTNYQVLVRNFLDGRRSLTGVSNIRRAYLDNVIEHLPREEGTQMLTNLFLAMESRGVIRLATPDLESICTRYLKRDSKYIDEMSQDMKPHGLEVDAMPDLLRVTYSAFGHEKGYIYDFPTLKHALESIGFVDIELFRPGISNRSELRGLESRMGKSDDWSQMCIEAVKP